MPAGGEWGRSGGGLGIEPRKEKATNSHHRLDSCVCWVGEEIELIKVFLLVLWSKRPKGDFGILE